MENKDVEKERSGTGSGEANQKSGDQENSDDFGSQGQIHAPKEETVAKSPVSALPLLVNEQGECRCPGSH